MLIEDFFKALSDGTRLRILLAIQQANELCVCELTEALATTQPKISRHLALLRDLRIVANRRQGQWIYYRLHPELPRWAQEVLAVIAKHQDQSLHLVVKRIECLNTSE